MKTHFGIGQQTLCHVNILLAKQTTTDLNAVDCLGCLWECAANTEDQLSRCLQRIKVVSSEAINKAEYRLNPPVDLGGES